MSCKKTIQVSRKALVFTTIFNLHRKKGTSRCTRTMMLYALAGYHSINYFDLEAIVMVISWFQHPAAARKRSRVV
jgi:hypothetical protein